MCTVDGNRTIRTIKSRSSRKCLSIRQATPHAHLGKVETRRPLRQVLTVHTVNGKEQVGTIFLFLLCTHFSTVRNTLLLLHTAHPPKSYTYINLLRFPPRNETKNFNARTTKPSVGFSGLQNFTRTSQKKTYRKPARENSSSSTKHFSTGSRLILN